MQSIVGTAWFMKPKGAYRIGTPQQAFGVDIVFGLGVLYYMELRAYGGVHAVGARMECLVISRGG